MSLESRVKSLEKTHGMTSGACNCVITKTRVYYPGNEPPADMPLVETCDECGGERRVIRIEVIYSREEVTTPLTKTW
jgi:hypothetical protein